jgi:predicted adenine nucleotide alpha hydrolase (AANH) superfamily ATPase
MNRPHLLLHICCGPCATTVIKRLKNEYKITGFFYNPNIFPLEEYQRRLESVQKLAQASKINILTDIYQHEAFLAAIRGWENEPEGGKRCEVCYRLRLSETALMAKKLGLGTVASTLTVGPNKKAEVINNIGRKVSLPLGLKFLAEDWKKKDGFKESVAISHLLGLYRQHYCGCEFSFNKKGENHKSFAL